MQNSEIYTQLSEAIGAHGAWKFRLRMAANKTDPVDISTTASDHHGCAFGRWLDGLPAQIRSLPEARDVIALHATFHATAGQTARFIAKGDKAAALAMLDNQLDDVSKKLNAAVAKWKILEKTKSIA
jgi:hypothetical protein